MKKRSFFKLHMGLVLAFLYVPIAVLIAFSFNESKSRTVFTGFTFKWYAELMQNDAILKALGVTLIVAAVSSVLATVIGTAASVGIKNMSRWGRLVVMNLSYMPIINPEIVTGVSLLLLFGVLRAVLGDFEMGIGTLIFAHTTFNLPYVIISVNPKLRQLNPNIYEAALDLGCTPVKAFFKVVVPEIMPGIFTGFLMALTYSIDDFVISYFNSGTSQTLPTAIFAMTRRKVSPEINALSTIMFVIIFSILIISNSGELFTSRSKKSAGGERRI